MRAAVSESNARMARPISILVVEDELDQAQLIRDTLLNSPVPPLVRLVASGEEAIAYLSGEGKFSNRNEHPFPFVVLLDLRMQGVGGFGVLRWLCAHPTLRQKLNLIVLSSVRSPKDIEVAYELGAQFFWAKLDCDDLQQRIQRLQESCLGAELHASPEQVSLTGGASN
jgi:CheY-like chemotaxis protein